MAQCQNMQCVVGYSEYPDLQKLTTIDNVRQVIILYQTKAFFPGLAHLHGSLYLPV